ncbi:MAG: ribbon-helix-helix domain-containing protein [Trueperaceae bacterium]
MQMTIEDNLLEDVDQLTEELGTTRSAFIRAALQAAIRKHRKRLLEQQHAQGYKELSELQSEDW